MREAEIDEHESTTHYHSHSCFEGLCVSLGNPRSPKTGGAACRFSDVLLPCNTAFLGDRQWGSSLKLSTREPYKCITIIVHIQELLLLVMYYMPQCTYLAVIPVSFSQILHDSFIFLDIVRTKMLPPTIQNEINQSCTMLST